MKHNHESTAVTNRATITFHTTPETKARLNQLATRTKRSKSFLTNVAVEQFLREEEDFITDVEAGITDIEAGRVFSTAEVKHSLREHAAQMSDSLKTA